MIWKIDFTWLMMAFAVVSMLSFFLGYAIDGLVGNLGFGPYGNGGIISAGFFLGIYGSNWYGIRFDDLTMATITGLAVALVGLLTLTFVKLALGRL